MAHFIGSTSGQWQIYVRVDDNCGVGHVHDDSGNCPLQPKKHESSSRPLSLISSLRFALFRQLIFGASSVMFLYDFGYTDEHES